VRNDIADILFPDDTDDTMRLRQGTVSGTSPLEVTIGEQSGLSAQYFASYTPVIDDVVAIIQTKTDLLVLGTVEGGG
jgi:hypothetical protein